MACGPLTLSEAQGVVWTPSCGGMALDLREEVVAGCVLGKQRSERLVVRLQVRRERSVRIAPVQLHPRAVFGAWVVPDAVVASAMMAKRFGVALEHTPLAHP